MCSGLFATRAAMVNTSLEAVHGVHMTINNVVMKAMTVNKVVTAAALISPLAQAFAVTLGVNPSVQICAEPI